MSVTDQTIVTLIPGDGIGPEVSEAVMKIIDASGANIQWDIVNAGADVFEKTGQLVPNDVYESIELNKIALKGPITTPVGSGFRSINVMLRKKYDLYSNIRPVQSLPGLQTPFKNLDLVIFRENTEGLYIGIEKENSDGTMEAKKIITPKGSERIIRNAFEYARAMNRKSVAIVHKANILKLADGLFLETGRRIAKNYPDIEVKEVIVDNMCMQLVMNPSQYDVIVTMNLYGDILSDLCAGLVGGLGLVPGANIGDDLAIFEAVHGSAPDIAGQGKANPIALLRSSCMMLDHLGKHTQSKRIRTAIEEVLQAGEIRTPDMGGQSTTSQLTDAIISAL
ncbi:isocitrate/isopropylmalate dehydrogenase family protein [Fusibacter sp. JL216-2]|uniref:isocitrate/isopropylmalate dehydrogenase family protein n=1 Tax=Fusibacter sp. JL216-2 TaxID=3071453 RepID=UPI003D34F994